MRESLLTEQLKALYAANHVEPIKPDEFCPSMFVSLVHCTRSEGDRLIADALRQGGIEYVAERNYNGKRVKAYRFVNK